MLEARGETTAGVEHRRWLRDPLKQGLPPVLGLAPAAALASSGHAALGHVLPGRPHLDGGVLQGRGAQGDLVATLQQQLHHIHVHQAQDRFPVDVCDEVPSTQSRLLRRAPLLHAPDHMVHRVHVAVSHVDTNGAKAEAVLLARAVDDDGGPQATTHW